MCAHVTLLNLQYPYDGCVILLSQVSLNIAEPYNSSSYAMDAVMTLALALNQTLEDPSLNFSLQTAIEDITFSGASVSLIMASGYIVK